MATRGSGASSPPGLGSYWAQGQALRVGGGSGQLGEARASVHMGLGAVPSGLAVGLKASGSGREKASFPWLLRLCVRGEESRKEGEGSLSRRRGPGLSRELLEA